MRSRAASDPAKRALDIVLSALAIAILSPLLAGIAIFVRLRLGSPILFEQTRPGLEGRPFTLIKFRSMTDARDAQGTLLPDERRLTRLGRLIRSASLDELPELVNVLKGQMSLVGPYKISPRDRHHYGTLRIAEPLGDRLVHFRVRDRLLELRQRSPEEGRIPFEPGFLRRKLFDLGHGRSLGFPSPCGGLLQLYDLLVEVTRNPAPTYSLRATSVA